MKMQGHYAEQSFTLRDDDKLAEAHTEAVNAGVYVRMEGNRTLSVLDHPEKLRKLSRRIFEINGQEGQQTPAGLGTETPEEKAEREEFERMQREEAESAEGETTGGESINVDDSSEPAGAESEGDVPPQPPQPPQQQS